MSEPEPREASERLLNYDRIYTIAGIWGIALGCLTFAAGSITTLSGNSLMAMIQEGLILLIAPGLYAAAVTGSFVPGALINAIFHFILCWLVLLLMRRLTRKDRGV